MDPGGVEVRQQAQELVLRHLGRPGLLEAARLDHPRDAGAELLGDLAPPPLVRRRSERAVGGGAGPAARRRGR